jgi:hypothetical protein
MADQLSSGLLARLQERAGSPERRSDTSEMAANSTGFDQMLDGMPTSSDPAVREYLEGMNTPFAGMIGNLVTGDGSQAKGLFGTLGKLLGGKPTFGMMGPGIGGPGGVFAMGGARKPRPAPRPCTEAEVAAAEAELGFVLPGDLRTFYVEVANGGVGPDDGIYSLKQLTAKWREFTKEPIGPRGQKWPARLLPISGDEWDVVSIDRDSGELIYWDLEEIDYGGWNKSFVHHADSLEAWLDTWLGRPSMKERAERRAERPPPRQLTDEDWRVWGEQDPVHKEYLRRLDIATMTPAERAAIGLTEDNWAEKMWDGLDLAGIKFPTPGYAERQGRRADEGGGEGA